MPQGVGFQGLRVLGLRGSGVLGGPQGRPQHGELNSADSQNRLLVVSSTSLLQAQANICRCPDLGFRVGV